MKRTANIPEFKGRSKAAFAEITVEMRKKTALAYRERRESDRKRSWVTSRSTTELKMDGKRWGYGKVHN